MHVCLGYETAAGDRLRAAGGACTRNPGAAAAQERAGTALGPKAPWQKADLRPTRASLLKLAEEWVRRAMESNDGGSIVLFAARTSLGNALAAGGRLAEAEVVARSNLETATAVYGAEHRFTLGTTHNLGLLLEQNGKAQEAEALFVSLLATQQRVLGPEARDTLLVATQVANSALGRATTPLPRRSIDAAQDASAVVGDDLSTLIVHEVERCSAGRTPTRRRSRRTLRRSGGASARSTSTRDGTENLGISRERGDYEKVERILDENVEVKARVLGEGHLDMDRAINWRRRCRVARPTTGDDALRPAPPPRRSPATRARC